jgi:RecA-family ATPase
LTPIERAQRYIDKCEPAISGQCGHSTAFSVVCSVVNGFALDDETAYSLLQGWNLRCQPPWTESELRHKIGDAQRSSHAKARGHLLGPERSQRNGVSHHPSRKTSPAVKPRPANYDLQDAGELPEPLNDGARLLIKTVFEAGEGIRIANARLNEDGHEIPDGAGLCISREEWLRKLDAAGGNPNHIWASQKRTGIYIGVNPMKIGGSKDSDVTAFRHTLFEFDEGLSLEEQFKLYQKSRLPCAAIIYSGGKSVHAWVRIDAANRKEYDERLAALYEHFESAGYKFDAKNKNPSRFSRLPHCVRFERRQELLALNTGCESFSEWMAEIQADGIGTVRTVEDLLAFDVSEDKNNVLGNRWLCRSGSALVIAPSGIGKSSIIVQASACFAVGRPFIGIQPVRALKVLIIQAENDDGDVAEMLQGVYSGLDSETMFSGAEDMLLRSNLVFIRDTTHTGFEFTSAVRRLIDRHKPDIVVLDPLLSFIGADISRQEVCSEFLRTWLNPISEATGVIWICVHHTAKPSNDPRSRKHWQQSDYGYAGIGSSELTNWARAIVTLEEAGQGVFRLRFSKRGRRAGVVNLDGSPTTIAWMRHAEHGIFWKQIEAPQEAKDTKDKHGGAPSKLNKLMELGLGSVVDRLTERLSKNELAQQIEAYAASQSLDVGITTCKKAVELLVENKAIRKVENGYEKR